MVKAAEEEPKQEKDKKDLKSKAKTSKSSKKLIISSAEIETSYENVSN